MKLLFILLTITTFYFAPVKAQRYDPVTLARKVFSKDTLTDINKYSIDEYNGHPNGGDLIGNLTVNYTLLSQRDTTAVVNVTLIDSAHKEFDVYLHLRKDTMWKVAAFRALSMSGIIVKVHTILTALTPAQVDSVINLKHTKKKDKRMFKSVADYRYILGNTGLTTSSDRELIDHFIKNRRLFENVKDQLIAKGIANTDGGTRKMKNIRAINKALKGIYIDAVYPDNESNKRNLNFFVGGILDNTVGYLYIRNEKLVPEMSPFHFIMIRKLTHNWYLYKTT